MSKEKKHIYQVFTRLFGNTNTNNIPWGTISDNGVGKFSDFNEKALKEIRDLGITHIWYTGVPHHALINDYTSIGISHDHPDVVKGRAGSPYAVKDYYNVNPDLANDPANRLEEFRALIERTHKAGLKLIIDIVPNHVARKYEGKSNPPGVKDFGAQDNTSLCYHVNNNFYYNPGEKFKTPVWLHDYVPLGKSNEPKTKEFDEFPAKWTGNGSRLSQPHFYDWYETVKLNYGINPEGHKDFPCLPEGFENKDFREHFAFWSDKVLPNTWLKFRDIALYWLEMGVDGFRYDMAELVPVEFWSFMNSSIKMKNDEALLLAEVYEPYQYRNYIHLGKMDYLYDKVEMYDGLKRIMQGHGTTDDISATQFHLGDIEHHMLHFLENHDEQRIASPEFAGDAKKAMPAMVTSACISTSPTMIYFGQEVGEPADENAGFGSHSRTSIFDYIGVPAHQRWMNNKKFDGGQLSIHEKELRDFYKRLLNFCLNSPAILGEYREVHNHNRAYTPWYNHHVFSFVRYSSTEKLLILCNFHPQDSFGFELGITGDIIGSWALQDGVYSLVDQLYGHYKTKLNVNFGYGKVRIDIPALTSFLLKLE